MAIDILPKEQTVSENFGQGLQTGLQGLLNNMAQQRATQMQAKQRAPALQQLLGLSSPEQALQYAYQPDSILKELVKHHLGAPERQAYGQMLNQLLGGQEGNQQPETEGQPSTNNKPKIPSITPEINPIHAEKLIALNQKQKDLDQKERHHKEKLTHREEEVAATAVQPFLTEQGKESKGARLLYNESNKALKVIDKVEKKYPTLKSLLPEELAALAIRDPDVRELMAIYNRIVTLQSNSLKGNPTNFKTKLVQAGKAAINQPIQTQRNILNSIISDAKDVFNTDKEIANIKEKHGGKYPRFIQTEIINRENARMNPLEWPEYYEEGTILEDNGKIHIVENKQWVEQNG